MARTKGHTHSSSCKMCHYWKHGWGKKERLTPKDRKSLESAKSQLKDV